MTDTLTQRVAEAYLKAIRNCNDPNIVHTPTAEMLSSMDYALKASGVRELEKENAEMRALLKPKKVVTHFTNQNGAPGEITVRFYENLPDAEVFYSEKSVQGLVEVLRRLATVYEATLKEYEGDESADTDSILREAESALAALLPELRGEV